MNGQARRPSLDVLRGADVVLLLVVEWLPASDRWSWLRHSPWEGIRVADVVFPLFLFLVGASAAVGRPRSALIQARRVATLVVVGLLFNAWGDSGADLAHLRVTGVLQMIGIAGGLAGLVISASRRRWRTVAAVTLGLLGVHAVVLSHLPLACGTGRLDPGCSAAWRFDRALVPAAHLYHGGHLGHDPEGVLSVVLGATALVLFGWLAGRLLGDLRRSALLAAAAAGIGGASCLVHPPMKRLWTPTFTLLLAAGCIAVLAFLARALDGRTQHRAQPVRWSLTALGRNALFVYIAQHVVLATLETTTSGDRTLFDHLVDAAGSDLAVVVLAVLSAVAVAGAMRAMAWYVTV
jgi:predicted acyltransferase